MTPDLSPDSPRELAVRPVWDLPVRVFHWLTVACFAGAWLTAESERWHDVHITCGYTLAGLVAFRVLWGVVGSGPARFSRFVRSPAAAWRYLRSLAGPQPEHHGSHNPAGGLAVLALLLLIAGTVALGWATETDRLPGALDEAHEVFANLLMAAVGVHLLGVAVGSLRHRENLPRAMWTGRKRAYPDEAAGRLHAPLAALLLAAVLGFWAWQWHSAPQADPGTTVQGEPLTGAGAARSDDDDDDDDD